MEEEFLTLAKYLKEIEFKINPLSDLRQVNIKNNQN